MRKHCYMMVLVFGFGMVLPAEAGETVKEGKHFKVICHLENETIAEDTLKIAEEVWKVGSKFYDVSKKSLKKPGCLLIISHNNFCNKTGYDAKRKQLRDESKLSIFHVNCNWQRK